MEKRMMRKLNLDDKKAQNITLTTIIIIALGIAVLVFLIWGFSTGWSNFWETLIGYGGSDVDTVRQSCNLDCEKGEQGRYGFCQQLRTVEYEDGDIERGSCSQLSVVDSCPNIDCDPDKMPDECEGKVDGKETKVAEDGECDDGWEEITDVAVDKGMVCCVDK